MAENKPNIALVDDDPKILELTAKYLTDQNLNVFTADSGSALDEIVDANDIDLIVLDLMMPEESGLNLCQRYRAKNINVPIIMLTAKGDEVDRIVGLEMGADDYLPKPFSPRELLARINAIIRRQTTLGDSISKTSSSFRFIRI
jgi:two-component system phosphate regulon response regulator OmpR